MTTLKGNSDLLVISVSIFEKLFIGGNLNRYVSATRIVFYEVHGGFGRGSSNQERDGALNFDLAYNLTAMNIVSRKSHLSSNL
jgi:hypothetical protein